MRIKRPNSTLALLSNAVAYRIVSTLGQRGQQTTAELGRALADVPISTLYRQLTGLRMAGIVRVVHERQARGAVERTYAIASRLAAAATPQEIATSPTSQVRSTIRNFIAMLAADVAACIEGRGVARMRRRLHAALYVARLTDEEYLRLIGDIGHAIKNATSRSENREGSRRHSFYLVALPEHRS